MCLAFLFLCLQWTTHLHDFRQVLHGVSPQVSVGLCDRQQVVVPGDRQPLLAGLEPVRVPPVVLVQRPKRLKELEISLPQSAARLHVHVYITPNIYVCTHTYMYKYKQYILIHGVTLYGHLH